MRLYCQNCSVCKCTCSKKTFNGGDENSTSIERAQWDITNSTYQAPIKEGNTYNANISSKIMKNIENTFEEYGSSTGYDKNAKYLSSDLHYSYPQLDRQQTQYSSSLPRNFIYHGLKQPFATQMHGGYCIHNSVTKPVSDQPSKTLFLCERCAA